MGLMLFAASLLRLVCSFGLCYLGSLIWFRFAWFGWVVLVAWGFCFPSGLV